MKNLKSKLPIFIGCVVLCVACMMSFNTHAHDTKGQTKHTTEVSSNDNEKCSSCNGQGSYECNMCDGTGTRTCSMCGGEGVVIVNANGDTQRCQSCNGKGGFKCGYCNNGKRKCSACYGTGKQRYIGR